MIRRSIAAAIALTLIAFVGTAPPARAATPPAALAAMQWRNVGPYRGGRSVAVAGVPGDPRTFYTGYVGGNLWKTTNAGRTWQPVMDSQPVATIGAVAVAPSDPRIVYVGSGEADMRSDIIHGNGMYRSADAGATWTHIGLDDTRQINKILVDPHDPNTLLVAALGHAYGANELRGVFRSTDGGATWTRVLFHDANTGAIDLAADPAMHTVFASLWQTKREPWSVYPPTNGPGSGLYRSNDGGVTWSAVPNSGLPSRDLGKIGLAVAPSDPTRVYAIVDAHDGGLYRSDDGGAHFTLANADVRLWQRGWYFCNVAVDPKNADLVYVPDTSVYRSRDGGKTFTAIKGSPDGDDFHQLWIDPSDGTRLAQASDQGTSISVDAAETWTSWFNQPTGQFYHVAADNAFPYHLFGAQQDNGAGMILSRSAHADIQERDWSPITAGGESNEIAPDPLDANTIYGGEVDREDLRTRQVRSVSPTAGRTGVWRDEWTMPLVFSAADPHALYAAHQVIFRTRNGGQHWDQISPDLARTKRGLVYAIAPSPLQASTVWAGTDDGFVHLTRNGGLTWMNVTPPGVGAWAHISAIDASHADAATAYVAVDRHRLDDDRPYLYVTHDFGRRWALIVNGIPAGSFINGVREDPVAHRLLFAATETAVYASTDAGASWFSLRANMPVVSVRDIIAHDGDLAIATHGRAFWIMDDIAPLRELATKPVAATHLFALQDAVRVRPYSDEAEASPPETPNGTNRPYGAMIDYMLGASGVVTIEIFDRAHTLVRRWASTDKPEHTDPNTVDYPASWIHDATPIAPTPGAHRLLWDFTFGGPEGVLVAPGPYTVTLHAGAFTQTQRLRVVRDPRVTATDRDLALQVLSARDANDLLQRAMLGVARAHRSHGKRPALDAQLDAIAGPEPSRDPRNSVGEAETHLATLRYEAGALRELVRAIESADAAPTRDQLASFVRLRAAIDANLARLDRVIGAT